MKLAFPTWGYSPEDFKEIFSSAKKSGYDAVEVLVDQEKLSDRVFRESLSGKKNAYGIGVSCLTPNTCLFEQEQDVMNNDLIFAYIDLAYALSVPYIQFMCDPNSYPEMDIDLDLVVDTLSLASSYGAKKNVKLLIETNGAFSDSHLLKDLLRILNDPQIGVLWNIHHPYRYCLESIAETYQTLKKYIRYVHLSDSLMRENGPEYCLLGKGDIPNKEALFILKDHQYQGFISWGNINTTHKGFRPDIISSHFLNYVRKI